MEELKKVRDGIYAKRRVTKESLSKRLQEGKQRLKSTPLRKREIPPTPLEKAVMSRRPFFEPSDGDEDFFPEEQDWETEGRGIADEADRPTSFELRIDKSRKQLNKTKKSGIVSA